MAHGSVDDRVRAGHAYAETTTDLHPYEAITGFDTTFALGLRLPDVKDQLVFDDDIPQNPYYTVYLMDPTSGSWATWRITPGPREYRVCQHGPRRLFDELADAYAWWCGVGKPAYTRFGLTVTSAGQEVWSDEPTNVVAIS